MTIHFRTWSWAEGTADGDRHALPDAEWAAAPRKGDVVDVPVGGDVSPSPWDKSATTHPGVVVKVAYAYPDPSPVVYIQLL